jgi:hypothetical protein
MTDFKKTMKALTLLLGLAVAMPFSAQAQTKSMYHEGSLMDDPTADWHKQPSLNNRSISGITWAINNDDFGTPLGSGFVILLGAGLGYIALKKKEDEQ